MQPDTQTLPPQRIARKNTKWTSGDGLARVKRGIALFRNGTLTNYTHLALKVGVPPRTLKRYVAASRNPWDQLFYMEETAHEKLIAAMQRVRSQRGTFSMQALQSNFPGSAVAAPFCPPTDEAEVSTCIQDILDTHGASSFTMREVDSAEITAPDGIDFADSAFEDVMSLDGAAPEVSAFDAVDSLSQDMYFEIDDALSLDDIEMFCGDSSFLDQPLRESATNFRLSEEDMEWQLTE